MIAVIAAMDKEVDAIVSIMESHEHLMKSGIDFDKGIPVSYTHLRQRNLQNFLHGSLRVFIACHSSSFIIHTFGIDVYKRQV